MNWTELFAAMDVSRYEMERKWDLILCIYLGHDIGILGWCNRCGIEP